MLRFEAADEVVDIMEPVVLDVERVPAEPCPVGERDALDAGCGMSTSAPIA
jgi:hypothetical protein